MLDHICPYLTYSVAHSQLSLYLFIQKEIDIKNKYFIYKSMKS